jgi:hypothetical protein
MIRSPLYFPYVLLFLSEMNSHLFSSSTIQFSCYTVIDPASALPCTIRMTTVVQIIGRIFAYCVDIAASDGDSLSDHVGSHSSIIQRSNAFDDDPIIRPCPTRRPTIHVDDPKTEMASIRAKVYPRSDGTGSVKSKSHVHIPPYLKQRGQDTCYRS